jgi:hypothetical protein
MSLTNYKEVQCECGEITNVELYTSVNAEQNPELKEILLAGELNLVVCPRCNNVFYSEDFLLYMDLKTELIAYVYPKSFVNQKEDLAARMSTDFNTVHETIKDKISFEPLLIFGLDNLVNLLHADEERNDEAQIVEYLCKEFKFGHVRLSTGQARKLGLPETIPFSHVSHDKTGHIENRVTTALEKIVNFSPDLAYSKQLLTRITGDKDFSIGEILTPLLNLHK